MNNFFKKIIPITIIAVATWLGVHFISGSSEKGKKKKAHNSKKLTKEEKAQKAKDRAAKYKLQAQRTLVETLTPVDFPVELQTQGIVKTKTSTTLNALVAGKVLEISPKFQDGAFFKKGDVLVQLDPADFKTQIITSTAALARAEADLIQEKARAAQALRNWKDIGFDEEPNDLVLRKPQLREAEANVAAQQASLEKAKRNLERTAIKAPINGRVRKRIVGPGQAVGASTNLGEIYATDSAEIRLPLSSKQLGQIAIDEQGNQSIPVTLTDAINSQNHSTWNATIKHVVGELDEASRELFVITHVDDPFGIISKAPPLRINQPVKATIIGNTIKNAILVDRKFLYGANEIILIEDEKVLRKKINILWGTQDHVITTDQDIAGKLIATSRLRFATDGTPVEIMNPESLPEGTLGKNTEEEKDASQARRKMRKKMKRSSRL